jgi:hypothetical protein
VLDPIGRAGANRNTITLQQSGPRRVPDIGPYRAPHNHPASQGPSTDRDRVTCGHFVTATRPTSPVIGRSVARSIGGLSLLHLQRQVTLTWLSPAPCPEESRLSSTRSCRAAATRPTRHRSRECRVPATGAARGRCRGECGSPASRCRRHRPHRRRCRAGSRSSLTPAR